MNRRLLRSLGILSLVILSGCGSAQKQDEARMNAEVQKQEPADTPEKKVMMAATEFSNIEGLSDAQKSKLSKVYSEVYTQSMQIRREIGQSKTLLFKTLANPNHQAKEVSMLKKKIVGLDQKRLDIMFGALDQVQAIVGKGPEADRVYRHLENYDSRFRDNGY